MGSLPRRALVETLRRKFRHIFMRACFMILCDSESILKLRIGRGCPLCHKNGEGKNLLSSIMPVTHHLA